ncbi:histidine phosphotransferase family protein [Rhodovulum adriaticum]|uniref:Histidine phosphotransferase ChpT n=1 Tax=Rhodovulum adriaticum TaxID=35804 RepID=A0A4R2NVI6_RHOAD|nr:histidine phosphotransferase family protein [Rhodovulum adriaticum]TCP26129.1 histidine phosphotransferase ChpT [Rhodovulum adriaticum]
MTDLAALVGSRICHDLVNPLGAIGNGLELLRMQDVAMTDSEEMALIGESMANATARLRLLRLAFGAAPEGAEVSGPDVAAMLDTLYGQGRLRVAVNLPPALPRWQARLAMLGLLCAETALPRGGTLWLTVGAIDAEMSAKGPRVALPPDLWRPLSDGPAPARNLTPAEVQFALFPTALAAAGRTLAIAQEQDGFSLRF